MKVDYIKQTKVAQCMGFPIIQWTVWQRVQPSHTH